MRAQSISLILLITLFGAATTSADTLGHKHSAQIPFTFHVGNSYFEPGDFAVYTIGARAVVVSRANHKSSVIVLTNFGGPGTENGRAVLVFNQYGDQCFLAKVVFSGGIQILPQSRAEKALVARKLAASTLEVRLTD